MYTFNFITVVSIFVQLTRSLTTIMHVHLSCLDLCRILLILKDYSADFFDDQNHHHCEYFETPAPRYSSENFQCKVKLFLYIFCSIFLEAGTIALTRRHLAREIPSESSQDYADVKRYVIIFQRRAMLWTTALTNVNYRTLSCLTLVHDYIAKRFDDVDCGGLTKRACLRIKKHSIPICSISWWLYPFRFWWIMDKSYTAEENCAVSVINANQNFCVAFFPSLFATLRMSLNHSECFFPLFVSLAREFIFTIH